jgi:hypothetical protein
MVETRFVTTNKSTEGILEEIMSRDNMDQFYLME